MGYAPWREGIAATLLSNLLPPAKRELGSERARRLREHGMSVSAAERHRSGAPLLEQYLETGFNFRMTDVQAAIGLVQLGRLAGDGGTPPPARADGTPRRSGISRAWSPPPIRPTAPATSSPIGCCCRPTRRSSGTDCSRPSAAKGFPLVAGIMASHREPAFAGHPHVPLPVTERLTDDSVILPLYHTMSLQDQDRVIDVVRRQLGG